DRVLRLGERVECPLQRQDEESECDDSEDYQRLRDPIAGRTGRTHRLVDVCKAHREAPNRRGFEKTPFLTIGFWQRHLAGPRRRSGRIAADAVHASAAAGQFSALSVSTLAPRALSTAGFTTVPNSSMAFMTVSCGRVPTESCKPKRSCLNHSCCIRILSITCCGDPMK